MGGNVIRYPFGMGKKASAPGPCLLRDVFCHDFGTASPVSDGQPVATGRTGVRKRCWDAALDPTIGLLPAKYYLGQYVQHAEPDTPKNVNTIGLAWKTQISDDGQQ